MFMIIREPLSGGGSGGGSAPSEKSAKQVQAAIKRKLEKQKQRSSGQAGGVGVIQSAQPPRMHRKAGQFPQMTAAAFEDRESLEEELEDMMEEPQKGEREEPQRGEREEEEEEEEPSNLLPIVNSMFGQRLVDDL
ncbi:hypothetical protein EYF80_011985 [Liparis tanakae]|uniref:Uncharacterized protein n=1 Tax=Liparis tanakae TaxID=230148 RepID=A0A4Z2IIR5_9TELE|nr:hypothetical protein EYF80_011985 [Liparis tanakae]